MIEAHMTGVDALDDALSQLSKRMGTAVVRAALKKAAQPIVDAAKDLVPVRTGRLRESLTVSERLTRRQRKGSKRMPGSVTVYIGGAWPKGAHAHLVEFGTAPHLITVDLKDALAGADVYGRTVLHPGTPARPFLRPAWDANKAQALENLGKELWAELEKARARLAKQDAKRAAKGL